MPEVKLLKPWRFYEDGCRPLDFKAGVVELSDEAIKVAKECGVVEEKEKPKKQKSEQSE